MKKLREYPIDRQMEADWTKGLSRLSRLGDRVAAVKAANADNSDA